MQQSSRPPTSASLVLIEDTVDVPTPQETAANVVVEEEQWKQNAITMTEEYILKYYSDKADAINSGITMGMYLGLRTGQVLSISLLLAMADSQLQKKSLIGIGLTIEYKRETKPYRSGITTTRVVLNQ